MCSVLFTYICEKCVESWKWFKDNNDISRSFNCRTLGKFNQKELWTSLNNCYSPPNHFKLWQRKLENFKPIWHWLTPKICVQALMESRGFKTLHSAKTYYIFLKGLKAQNRLFWSKSIIVPNHIFHGIQLHRYYSFKKAISSAPNWVMGLFPISD